LYIPPIYTHYITTGLFFFFGVKLLWDSYHGEEGESGEGKEVEEELNEIHHKIMEKKRKAKEENK